MTFFVSLSAAFFASFVATAASVRAILIVCWVIVVHRKLPGICFVYRIVIQIFSETRVYPFWHSEIIIIIIYNAKYLFFNVFLSLYLFI